MTTESNELLQSVQIATPCHESWDAMTGNDKERFCGSCQLNVYNLSAMSADETSQFLTKHQAEKPGERLCVRLFKREDGTVLTQDCPVGLKIAHRRQVKRFWRGAAVASVTIVTVLGAHMAMAQQQAEQNKQSVMGKVRATTQNENAVQGSPCNVKNNPVVMGRMAPPPKDIDLKDKNSSEHSMIMGEMVEPSVNEPPCPDKKPKINPEEVPTMGIVAPEMGNVYVPPKAEKKPAVEEFMGDVASPEQSVEQ